MWDEGPGVIMRRAEISAVEFWLHHLLALGKSPDFRASAPAISPALKTLSWTPTWAQWRPLSRAFPDDPLLDWSPPKGSPAWFFSKALLILWCTAILTCSSTLSLLWDVTFARASQAYIKEIYHLVQQRHWPASTVLSVCAWWGLGLGAVSMQNEDAASFSKARCRF